MASMAFQSKTFKFVPPDKGSFPLDHYGVCKDLMLKYMICLKENHRTTSDCREQMKNYLDCRMNNELMAKEPWSKLGLADLEETKVPEKVV